MNINPLHLGIILTCFPLQAQTKLSHRKQNPALACVCWGGLLTSDTPLATCKVSLRIGFLLNAFKSAFVSNRLQFVKTPVPEGWNGRFPV